MEDVEKFMAMEECSREEAEKWLAQGDFFEALCLKHNCPPAKKRRLNETQEFFAKLRTDMAKLEDGIRTGFKKDESDSLKLDEMQTLPEEMVQQNSCYQECQQLFQELEVRIPETACPSPSGYFYDLQLSDQKLT
jgi:hypothetical protein